MKKSVKNILFGVAALALGISVGIFNALAPVPSLFLSVVAAILASSSILFFIVEAVDRSRAYVEERRRIDKANAEHFEGAEQIPVLSTGAMFREEFDVDRGAEENTEQLEDFVDDSHAEFIDPAFTMLNAVEEFKRFALERGFRLSDGAAENLLTSFVTSKLIVTDGLSAEDFNSLMLLIGEYFGNNVYVESLDEDGAFFSHDDHGEHEKKNVLLALEDAVNAPERVQLAAINGVNAENALSCLAPFMSYIHSPKPRNEIVIYNEQGANVGYNISSNFYIVLNLSAGEKADRLPSSVLSLAALNRISFTKTLVSDNLMITHGFSSYQLDYILEKESGKHEISEEIWKKVDKLEKYATGCAGYRIGNKLWRNFEKQVGLLLACGVELNDAADYAIAMRLLPSISAAICGKISEDELGLSETMNIIFGEEYIPYCKSVMLGFATVAQERRLDRDSDIAQKKDTPKTARTENNVEPTSEDDSNSESADMSGATDESAASEAKKADDGASENP